MRCRHTGSAAISLTLEANDSDSPPRARADRARWGAAALLAGLAHAGVVWVLWRTTPDEAADDGASPAAIIDLAPLPVAPESPPQDAPPVPQMTDVQPAPVPQTPPSETPPDAPAPPMTNAQPAPDMPPSETPPESAAVAEAQPAPDTPLHAAPVPALDATLEIPAVSRPKPKVEHVPPPARRAPTREPVLPERRERPQTSASPHAPERRAEPAAASRASILPAPSPGAVAAWQSAVSAHINRYKRSPANTGSGVAKVAFTISRSGQVLSVRLIGSAGDSALDQEAVAMMHRASPLPAPPAGVGGPTITLTLPVRFSR